MTDSISDSSSLLGNRYQLQQAIGTGGMATVYLARDLMLERPVAIKLLKKDLSTNPSFRKRFQQEARAAANLSHPNIVTVHDFGFHKGRLFIVMEHVPGQNLKEILREIGKFPMEEALPLIIQACSGIGYAHRAGLVHCDIKPHNMLVSPDQRLKVTDFGIAQALSTIHPNEKLDVVWGSPQYFSPEQASGLAPSPASDVYSLGVIIYEMLAGSLPFVSDDPVELSRLHREIPPPRPRQYNPEIPIALEQIILKVLSKEPSARYRTTDQLGRILETLMQQTSQTGNQTAKAQNHRELQNQKINHFDNQQQSVKQNNSAGKLSVEANENFDLREEKIGTIDWLTILLGFVAVLAIGGLIPFWIYIWFMLNAT